MLRNGPCRHNLSRRFYFTLSSCLVVATVAWTAAPTVAAKRPESAATAETQQVQPTLGSPTSLPQDESPQEDSAADAQDQPSDAERIAALNRTIAAEEERVQEMQAELDSPDSEYRKAEREFQEIDHELEQKRESLAKFKAEGQAAAAAQLDKEIKTLEKDRKLAKDRFDLAIEERKALRDEMTTLAKKIQKDRAALDELSGAAPKESASDDTGDANKPKHKDESPASDDAHDSKKDDNSAGDGAPTTAEKDGSAEPEPTDEELMQAEAEAKQKADEAEEAQEEVQSIAARIADLQKLIGQQQKAVSLARKQAVLALATERSEQDNLAAGTADGAPAEELAELREKIAAAAARLNQARTDVADATERLGDSQSELASLQAQQIIALQEAGQKQLEAEAAQDKVADLRNPFAPRNVLQWLLDHGPRLLIMIAGIIAVLQFAKLFSHRTIKLVARGTGRGSADERENRAKTLVGVFQNATSVAIVIGGGLMILDEIGVKVAVLLGGVAVVGLAVAFGAQNLIKDYFYGFVMLLENQYMINDMVKIGDFTGQVERITLRMTVLRDANGVVHFIPNGQINSVSNETHGWSRAVIEIGVAYKEDASRVIDVLTELNREFRRDPTFGPLTIDDATPPAVDSLGDSAVVIKYAIKTRPAAQTPVRRELLRRIKARFDSLGIEIPFPQRTVYHRYEDGVAVANPPLKRVA